MPEIKSNPVINIKILQQSELLLDELLVCRDSDVTVYMPEKLVGPVIVNFPVCGICLRLGKARALGVIVALGVLIALACVHAGGAGAGSGVSRSKVPVL